MIYKDRYEAGRILAARLETYAGRDDVLVLGLPRGGVEVAYEVARALDVPLGVLIVRKLGVPGQPELAMGAIASGDVTVINHEIVRQLRIAEAAIEAAVAREARELDRREQLYHLPGAPALDVKAKTVILVDDGLATGATMKAAVAALREKKPARIVVAVPVAARETRDEFRTLADEIICERTPEPFAAVGYWYQNFAQTTDASVRALLEKANAVRAH